MRRLAIVLALLAVGACRDTNIIVPSQPTATSASDATQAPPKALVSKIEFRVTGNAQSVKIRYSTERDGLTQLVTSLPFFVSFNSTQDYLFLSLEVTPITFSGSVDFPFLNAQIFTNGDLFKEASSTSPFLSTISVDGTWRR